MSLTSPALPGLLPDLDDSSRPQSQLLPPWNVVLLDDNDHTYEYVVEMLARLFGHPQETCWQMAREVDLAGRVIVCTTHRERAELEQQRIHGYGADWRILRCLGSMSATLEPACGG